MLLLVKLWDGIKDSQDLILWLACGWRWCLDTWANSSGTFLRSFVITSYAQLSKSQFVWGPGHRDCCHTQSSSSAVPQAARPASEKMPEDSFSYVRSMWIYVWLNDIQIFNAFSGFLIYFKFLAVLPLQSIYPQSSASGTAKPGFSHPGPSQTWKQLKTCTLCTLPNHANTFSLSV